MNINLILGLISILGLVGLGGFVVWMYLSLKGLLKGAKDSDFLEVIKSIEDIQKFNTSEINRLDKTLKTVQAEILNHVQKVGLVKFNPFNETGGDHSFSLVLLDGNKNGIIITSLHTRERTRLYTKIVESGKSNIELSNEESKALNQALK